MTTRTGLRRFWRWPNTTSYLPGWPVFYGGMHSKLLEQTQNSFLVQGVAGKGLVLYYNVRMHDANSVMIEPIARIEGSIKFGIVLRLLLMCVVPVVFAPLIITNKRNQAKKFSAELLPVFCSYLESSIFQHGETKK